MRWLLGGGIGVLSAGALVAWLALFLRWGKGRAPEVSWLAGIVRVPRRYLVDVHHVVARRPKNARMHALVAGGLLGGILAALIWSASGWWPFRAAAMLLLASCLIGVWLDVRRRTPRPASLSGGAFDRFPMTIGALAFAMLYLLVPVFWARGAVAPVFRGACLLFFGGSLLRQIGLGPMRHALGGVAWLAGHTRPGRFATRENPHPLDTALRPLDLQAPVLGAVVPADFLAPELASFDACVQCGRCEEACPAFAAGQRLNPKALIQGLSGAMRKKPPHYAGSVAPMAPAASGTTGMHVPVIGNSVSAETLWACTTCRACVEECPMLIEHVDAIISLRRGETLMRGAVREGAARALRHMRERAEPGGRALAERNDSIAALDVPVLAAGEETDILLWVGEGGYDLRYGRTLRALVTLMRKAGLRFATLGAAEVDCGDLARRLGDEATFQALAQEAIATLGARRFARIVTADPHAFHVLKNEYPALGGYFPVLHHTELLDALVTEGALSLTRRDGPAVAYHDPCYLARYNGGTDAPRRLLDAACTTRVEMTRHGMNAMCCGGGGGNPASDVDAVRRIPDLRMEQAGAVKAAIVAVACPGCTAMLEGVTGPRADVRDIAEIVLAAVAS